MASAQRFAPKTMQRVASALRSFFSYAFMTGQVDTDLSGAVPGVAYRPAQLPKFLTPQQVQALWIKQAEARPAGGRHKNTIRPNSSAAKPTSRPGARFFREFKVAVMILPPVSGGAMRKS